jgi:hypothetical protein
VPESDYSISIKYYLQHPLFHPTAHPYVSVSTPAFSQRISREEFRKGCELLNSTLSEDSDQRLTNIDQTLTIMDFDGSDDLDINEFFEVRFRIFLLELKTVSIK